MLHYVQLRNSKMIRVTSHVTQKQEDKFSTRVKTFKEVYSDQCVLRTAKLLEL